MADLTESSEKCKSGVTEINKHNMSDFQEYKLITDNRLEKIEKDIEVLKEDIEVLKEDTRGIKEDMKGIKSEIEGIKSEIKSLAQKIDLLMNNALEKDNVAKPNRPNVASVIFQDLDAYEEDIALEKRDAPDKNK